MHPTVTGGTDRAPRVGTVAVDEAPERPAVDDSWVGATRRRTLRIGCRGANAGVGAPSRPRRLLRRRRAARQAVAARQAGRRRRRRRPRRGRHRLLRGPAVRRPLGHVDAGGALALPARGVPDRSVPRLPRHQRPGDGDRCERCRRSSSRSPSTRRSSTSSAPGSPTSRSAPSRAFAQELRERVREATGGLTASVGLGTSKFIAKVASDLDKPDGLVVVAPGTEQDLLRPMSVTVIPGVGPATAERLRRAGIHTVADLERVDLDELVRLVGKAHGTGLHQLSRALDDRPVVAEREAKSVSVEGTYETDLDRPQADGGPADPAGRRGRHPAAQARPVGAHRDRSRCGCTTSPRSAGRAPCPSPPTARRPSPGWRGGCWPTSTPRAASGCSASACPGSPTGSRTTSSARPSEEAAEVEAARARRRRSDVRRGGPARTWSTTRWAAAGCGARVGAW